jgi:hypothetical protein
MKHPGFIFRVFFFLKEPAKEARAYSLGREPQEPHPTRRRAQEVGGSIRDYIADARIRRLANCRSLTWGLHPRLYAHACFARL